MIDWKPEAEYTRLYIECMRSYCNCLIGPVPKPRSKAILTYLAPGLKIIMATCLLSPDQHRKSAAEGRYIVRNNASTMRIRWMQCGIRRRLRTLSPLTSQEQGAEIDRHKCFTDAYKWRQPILTLQSKSCSGYTRCDVS